ncbi:helix-turn-helix domain-containing protein [Thalassotalea litorea]|uniref:Helix-turn-helix domain-containing protein n=1 Tax=Thalassotalea litorea TaxID=2020715 RepID=A0A5R9IPI4_9GAMM|nr:AraC family transcriptional regulator [Thalassotalea litorea]TLU65171.1 helix-turn-helix domain-containing protein [Thalassotalea litorea]
MANSGKTKSATRQVYCEPYCIEQGLTFEVHHVRYLPDDHYSCLMHFHEVHEFIIFEQVDGFYLNMRGQSAIADNSVVFTPAMESHDFELSTGEKSWYIVQFLPSLFNHGELKTLATLFNNAQNLHPKETQTNHGKDVHQRLLTLVKWLQQSYKQDPHSAHSQALIRLLILTVAEFYQPLQQQEQTALPVRDGFARLAPLMGLFKNDENIELTLEQAAEKCFLSPSYFSRLFKRVFRCNYSEYVVRHKLAIAARQLSQSERSITQISYDLGFANPSHFIAQFKKTYQETPLQFRKKLLTHISDGQWN